MRKIFIFCCFLFLLFLSSCDENNIVTYKLSIDFPDSSTQSISVLGVNFLMKYVENGTFTMGIDFEIYPDSSIVFVHKGHKVTLTKDYWIGETEVTQDLWQAVMGYNPSYFKGNLQRPVEGISFYEAAIFCNKLSLLLGKEPVYSRSGETDPSKWGGVPKYITDIYEEWSDFSANYQAKGFRLPTEAEWEYAALGGKYSKNYMYSGSNNIYEVAVWNVQTTEAVKTKKPNELYLYDMTGNVMEWCNDYYAAFSDEPQIDPTENDVKKCNKANRVTRGGSFEIIKYRTTQRTYADATVKYPGSIGLRIVIIN